MGEGKGVLIVAGESSGDLHGSSFIQSLHRLAPRLRFFGIGGKRMKEAGQDILYNSKDLAVVGLVEVLSHLPIIWRAFRAIKRVLDESPPQVAVLIDYPDFNLRLARILKKRGIPIVYYISPQVWAWRRGRVKEIARLVDKMLVIFPFEVPIYKAIGVDVEYVGHPLMDRVGCHLSKEGARASLGLETDRATIAFLPGSRRGEVERLLPVMLKAGEIIKKERDAQFVLPLADTLRISDFRSQISDLRFEVKVISGQLYKVLRASDIAIVASGTATMETALMGIPMVIVYKVHPLTYWIGRMLIQVDTIGIPNILIGKKAIPELIQGDANPVSIAGEVLRILKDNGLRDRMEEDLKEVRERLARGSPVISPSERVARIVYEMMRGQDNNHLKLQNAK